MEDEFLKEFLDEIQDVGKIGGWELDLKTMKTYFTKETFKIYGLEGPNPPKVEDGIKFYAPEARPIIQKAVDDAIKKGLPYELELPFINARKEKLWVKARGKIKKEKGVAIKLYGTLQDITSEKKKEEKRTLIQRRFKALFDSSRDGIMTLEPPTWSFTSGNKAAIEMFNCKDEKDFVSHTPGSLSPEKQPDGSLSSAKAKAMIMKAMKEGSNFFDWTHKKASGENFPATVLLSRVELEEGKPFLQATVRDITKQKFLNDKFEAIFDSVTVGILGADPKSKKFLFVNKAICEMTGYTSVELLRLDVSKIHPKKDLPNVLKQFERQMKGEIEVVENLPVLRKDGKIIFCDITSTPKEINGEEVLLGIFNDVTKKRSIEKLLVDSEKRYKEFLDNAEDLVQSVDASGKYTYVNKKWLEVLGYNEGDIGNLNFMNIISKEDGPHCMKIFGELKNGKPHARVETSFVKKDKSLVPVEGSVSARFDSSGKMLETVGIFHDMTNERKNQDELKKFNSIAVDRELKMVELKKEVNSLLKELGKKGKYIER